MGNKAKVAALVKVLRGTGDVHASTEQLASEVMDACRELDEEDILEAAAQAIDDSPRVTARRQTALQLVTVRLARDAADRHKTMITKLAALNTTLTNAGESADKLANKSILLTIGGLGMAVILAGLPIYVDRKWPPPAASVPAKPSPTHEYLIEHVPSQTVDLDERLSELGKQGWAVVSIDRVWIGDGEGSQFELVLTREKRQTGLQ